MNVRVEGVGKRYDGRPVLAGISFELARGQCLLIRGPNGSGKSTLLRIVATLVRPTFGRVLYDGRTASEWGPQVRRRIGVLFHDSLLYDELTAEENLLWYARLYGVVRPREVVGKALEQVGLTAFRRERVGTFSRGMRQRLAWARSLLADPDLVLWDEPQEGLDERALARLEAQLAALQEREKTLVIVAHQWERLWPYAHQTLDLAAGQVVRIQAGGRTGGAAGGGSFSPGGDKGL